MLQPLRAYRASLSTSMAVILAAWQITQPIQAATFYWDTDGSDAGNAIVGTSLGGTGTWDIATSNWWPVPSGVLTTWGNTSADIAIFSGPFSALPTLNTVTLSGALMANQVRFDRSGYTLAGGTSLTLAGANAGLYAQMGESATINTVIDGTVGLTKSGGGSVRLGGTNTYSGTTTIAGGALIISNQNQLGAASSAINVTGGNDTPSNTTLLGITGGSLVLDGTGGAVSLTRALNLEGRGAIGNNNQALWSLGNNTISSVVTTSFSSQTPATFRNTRVNATDGLLTLSGTLNVLGTTATTFTSLGGVNSAGNGSFLLSGTVTGSGSIEKSGAGTLFLNPTSTSGFTGTLRISGSATGQQSSVRVTQATVGGTSVFGSNTGTNASAAIDMNGGVLEFLSESSLDFNSLSTGKNVYLRANSTFYTGPAAGGQGVGGVTSLGTFRVAANTTGTFNSRNGYGITLGAWTPESSNNPTTITNNMGGTLTFTGAAWGNNDTTARTLTIQGNGNTAIAGNVTATGANHVLTKGGTGLLSIAGTASTFLGNTNITGGAIQVTDFRSINNNTAAISLGNATTTGGNLIIGGTGVGTPTAAGLTTSKTITLNTTSASNSIYANQTGTNPVILNGAITKIAAATTGNLILGGTNTTDNIVNVAVPVETTPSTGGLVKLGTGTWVLNAANTYAGSTQIQAGALKLRATAGASDVIKEAASNTIVFTNDAVTQTAGGTMEFRGFLNAATTETLGALTPTSGAAKIVATANGTGSTTLTFTSLGARGAGATVDYQPGAFSTIAFGTAPTVTNGILGAASASAFQTFKGVDWATLSGSNVVAFSGYTALPVSFSGTGGAAVNYSTAANASSTGTASVNTLKLVGAVGNPTLTLGGVLTLTGRAILFDNTNGVATITGSQLGAIATEVHVITNGGASGNALTINSLIGGTTGSFTKSGTGTLIVGGNNAFTGNVIINEGTVQLSGGTATLGVNSTAANITTLRQDATLDINAAGVSQTIGVGALQGAGTITNSGGGTNTAGTISFGRSTSTGTTVFSGILQDGGGVLNVTVDGTTARTQSFIGQSSYTGVTTIATGAQLTVDVLANGGSNSGIGASSSAAANLVFNGTAPTLIYRGNLRTGSLNLGSASATTDRLFTISGSGAVLSSTVTNNNAIVWSNTGAIIHGTNADRTLTLTGTSAGDNTFNPQLTNSTGFVTSLTKSSTGQWNLGNTSNTYTGATTVSNGILGLNNNGALPSGSPVVLGSTTTSGILQMSGTLARNLTTTPAAGTGTITWGGTTGGGGFAAHATTLTVTLDGGAGVTWGSGGFVGTGGTQALIFGSASALADVVFTNAINLGSSSRTVTVNDNGNTGADYATLSGVLSGTGGGLIKNGSGILRLTGANTYTGTTEVQAGTLVVSSLGSSGSAGATSVGDQQTANTAGSAIILGNATTTGGILQYVGTGETSDRYIRLNGTTASNQIHADGSGALILTNVANDFTTPTGAKTLFLRGSSAAGNMITSQLTNDGGGGTLGVTIDGAATWILTNGANSFTGTTTVSSGALGIGHDTAIGGAIAVSNGNVFAYGADRTIANAITLNNNANWGFVGDYSLTFTNASLGTSANSNTLGNSIVAGKSLTFQGLAVNGLNANRSWTLDGPGETVVNGVFSTSTAFGLSIVKTGNGTLTLGTNGATSNWNQAAAGIDLDRGTLKFTASNAINSSASTFGGLTISPEIATVDTATVDLNGTTQTINNLTATTDGTSVIDNTSSSAAAFRFGANNSAVTFGNGTGTYSILNTGAGALDIVKLGNTTAAFISGITLAHKGVTASEEGGVFNIASPVTATSGLRAVGASTLALTGGVTNPNLITSIEVGGGSTLTLLDGTGSAIANLANLNLGAGSGTATLNLNVGDISTAGDGLGTDTLTLLTGGTLSLGNTHHLQSHRCRSESRADLYLA